MASSFPIRLGLEDAFRNPNDEEEPTAASNNESMFQDEIVPTTPSSQRSFHSRQFDPFAPQDQDEVVPATAPSASPVLIPMNPDADADLLGGTTILPKHAGKAIKDPKITSITYPDGDDLLSGIVPEKAPDDSASDKFVDDDEAAATNGGFFSRIRNPFARNAATSGDPKPPTNDPSPTMPLVGGLEDGGNSLPHPDQIMPGSTRDFIEESDDDSQGGLEGNGNSLPHPDQVMPGSTRDFINESDDESQNGLDQNGNSLPHPDQVMPGSTRDLINESDGEDQGVLDENGNSLPHPEEVRRVWGRSARKSAEDILDTNGNSLPHPDSVKAQEEKERVLLNDTLRLSDTSTSSEQSLDRQRLMQALADSGSVEENDVYYANSTDDSDIEDESDQEPSSKMLTPDDSARGPPSFRLGNLKMSLRSTFKKAKDQDSSKRGDEFRDEEVDRTESPTHTDADFLDVNTPASSARQAFGALPPPSFDNLEENGNSLQNTAALDDHRRKSTLRSLRNGISNALRPRSTLPNATPVNADDSENSSSSNLFLPANADEESNIPIVHPIEIDGFDDESKNERYNQTRTEQLKTMLHKHANNPKSRRTCCLVTALVLIFLGMLIPLVHLARERRKWIEDDENSSILAPVTPAPSPAPTPERVCEDEIMLTDSDDNDLESGDEYPVCLTTKDPIHFRFKRCRPASPLDWVGIFAEGSVFLGRLWDEFVDGTYLCGGQPCPIDDPNNKKSDPPRAARMKAPPIQKPGVYRLFLVEDSPWPYDYSKYTDSFQVVEDEKFCPNLATLAPTSAPTDTVSPTTTYFPTYYPTYYPTSTEPPTKDNLFV